jgi:hypothetical protein
MMAHKTTDDKLFHNASANLTTSVKMYGSRLRENENETREHQQVSIRKTRRGKGHEQGRDGKERRGNEIVGSGRWIWS